MADHTVLYLLRHPLSNQCSFLGRDMSGSARSSLVLLEAALSAPPGFVGPVYRLQEEATSENKGSAETISYRELLRLIAEHDRTIVL
jgi:hypothetical protein